MHMYLSAIMAGLLGICWVPHRAAYRYRFFDIDTDTDTTFRYRYQCDPYRDIHVPYYPEWGYSTLKSGELPSRAPHTTYCNCLCSNNVQWQLPQSLPGQCSHIKFLHFIGINRYFMVSRMIFYNIIVTFLSNTRCKYRFRVLFWVSFRYPGSVSGDIDIGSCNDMQPSKCHTIWNAVSVIFAVNITPGASCSTNILHPCYLQFPPPSWKMNALQLGKNFVGIAKKLI